ncbi:unnamed protein product, partial [Sphacelaria rigidula]
RRRTPPQRRGTVVGGDGWEASLRSGDARIARYDKGQRSQESVMTFRSGHDLDDSGITDFAEHAAQQGNGTQEDTAVDKALMGSGRAHHNHLCEPGSESSMRRWLQDDTDDSDDDNGGVSARHSWYTANRQRGGHAPDIQHANSMARAAALARVRNAIKKASQTGVMGGTGEDLPSGTSEIPPTIDGLPSSARARHHRSPSWAADDK